MPLTKEYWMVITAKPVVANRYWILRRDDRKVGTVERDNTGFFMRVDGVSRHFRTLPLLRRSADIEFQPAIRTTQPPKDSVHGYDTGCRVHNGMWDVKRRLPLFTKINRSKSWYAAGWYAIQQHRRWQVVRNPKLILLDRYKFRGPYMKPEQVRTDP